MNKILYKLYNRVYVFYLLLKTKIGNDINYNNKNQKFSTIEIDIVIPIIERDLEVLNLTIQSIRKHILHKINSIYIVAPDNKNIINFCKNNNCIFFNENKVLPFGKKDINYIVDGIDRSGWVFQQLLKYGMKDYVEKEFFLITESEAVFLQDRIFELNGRIIMPVSNSIPHQPYFNSLNSLLGTNIKPLLNFTSHHSLFSKKVINNLLKTIEEKSEKKWYDSIIDILDPNEASCISDYETYGQYFYNYYKSEIILEHWLNIDLPRLNILNFDKLKGKLQKKYKVLSFSRYLN